MPFVSAEKLFPANRDEAGRQEFWACLALRHCRGLGARSLVILLEHFGSAYAAVQGVDTWADLGISPRCARAFHSGSWRDEAKKEWDAARAYPAGVLCWSELAYPAWLRAVSDAPVLLYCVGDTSLLRNVAVAVVGRRECSVEGLRATVHIARGIAQAGVTIVSGMARGVDRAAHLAGLEGPGSSIGVLGTGIDAVYPQDNADLFALMRRSGLLVSEYPPYFGVDGRFFPVRNRIISGLAQAVVITEAAVRSGSLNTARHALEQDRELMAVPGPVTAFSAKGCQELVRRGAKAVFSADDVLREMLPHLAAHVREALEERDRARFMPGNDDGKGDGKGDGAAEQDHSGLQPGLLPWGLLEQPDEAPKKRAAKSVAPHSAPHAPAPQQAAPKLPPPPLAGREAAVHALLCEQALHIDDICRRLGHNAGVISGILTMLEIQGHVRRLPGMVYSVR